MATVAVATIRVCDTVIPDTLLQVVGACADARLRSDDGRLDAILLRLDISIISLVPMPRHRADSGVLLGVRSEVNEPRAHVRAARISVRRIRSARSAFQAQPVRPVPVPALVTRRAHVALAALHPSAVVRPGGPVILIMVRIRVCVWSVLMHTRCVEDVLDRGVSTRGAHAVCERARKAVHIR